MGKAEELGRTLQEIGELETKLAGLRGRARVLWEEVGRELGVAHVEPHSSVQLRRPGPPPKRGDKSDFLRSVEAVTALAKPVRVADVHAYLEQVGTPVPVKSVGSYLGRAARENLIRRVEGEKGLYEALSSAMGQS